MSEVRLAHDTLLDRVVAVKILRPELAHDPAHRARFRREARQAAALGHPSIVAVHDSGEEPGGCWIAMEYVDGPTLRDLLRGGGALPPDRALRLVAGVLDALAHAHRGGVVHRDIKPSNVMLTRDGALKVMDFGIARSLAGPGSTLTGSSVVLGTAEYLSPEQARGERVDARADLYSTGCLLYELLAGRPPFTAQTPLAVVLRHLRDDPLPPSAHVPGGLPPGYDEVVLRALAKDRESRWPSAEEMRSAITAMLAAPGGRYPQVVGSRPSPGLSPGEGVPPWPKAYGGGGHNRAAPARRQDPPPPPLPAPRRATRRAAVLVALAAVLLVAGVVVRPALQGRTTTPATATVRTPSLVGRTMAEARAEAKAAGLRLVRTAFRGCAGTRDVRARTVCAQSPAPGAGTAPRTVVRVTLSP